MKLKSLFLASLAAIAFVSCSNEEDATINGGEVGTKDAIVQFGISFSNTVTRALEAGSPEENTFTRATIVIVQDGKKNSFTRPLSDFSPVENGDSPSILWLKEKIAVNDGPAEVYVFLNASDGLIANLDGAYSSYPTLKESVDFSTGIAALEQEGKIAAAGNFLMCNADGKAQATTFTKNTTNQLTVRVGRVAAKLQEMTPKDNIFDVTDDATNLANKEITVSLSEFAYAGLQQDTYVLKNSTPITANLYKAYNSGIDFEYQNISGDVPNYCMENLAGTDLETTTNIIYKGNIVVEGVAPGTTIYITSDNKAFTSISEMKENGIVFDGLDENTSIEDCWNKFILRKYENGACYYIGQIKTTDQGNKIIRNNIYRLSVNTIAGLGTVLPKPFEEPTLLNLTVEIEPWTINLNSFDF